MQKKGAAAGYNTHRNDDPQPKIQRRRNPEKGILPPSLDKPNDPAEADQHVQKRYLCKVRVSRQICKE